MCHQLGGVTHAWVGAEGDAETALSDALRALEGAGLERRDVAHVRMFRDASQASVADHTRPVGLDGAAWHVVSQAPATGQPAAVLLWAVSGAVSTAPSGFVRVDTGAGALHITPQVPHRAADPLDWAGCFDALDGSMQAAGLDFDDVILLWTHYSSEGQGVEEDFADFCLARSEFYAGRSFKLAAGTGARSFPASTGIAASGGRSISGVAAGDGLRTRTLANPSQVDPSRYAGPPRRRPLFSRAVEVALADGSLLLVSGTASMLDGQVRHPHDLAAQCGEVSRLLASLLGQVGVHSYASVVSYVASPSHGIPVRAFLETQFPGLPVLVVVAPLSRDGLLVELEATAVCHRSATQDAGAPLCCP